ncbi:MAG: tetraacyldisaccharide 4'-kinase [Proteobacteria bacterium]|nr:tetraacyldisaccharide 4'-kinase [Candidatus Enterousia scatequi]
MKTPYWFLHKTPVAFVLWPFSWVYYLGTRAVYKMRMRGAYSSKRPVICVGNILAGGVGKTPIVREIAKYFDAPVVMRGYKQDIKSGRCSDEAIMLANDGIQVHTGDRKSNIILLDKQSDKTPIIMDDGFQNSSINKKISVIVFDESIGFGNGFLLPAGPLREVRSALSRADAFVIIKSDTKKARLELPVGKPLFYVKTKTVSPYSANQRVVAFAGIGYPKKFFRNLKNVVAKRAFPDHYQYTDDDLQKLIKLAEKKKAKLITTEKDWVRLSPEYQQKIKFASLNVSIDNGLFSWLKDNLK